MLKSGKIFWFKTNVVNSLSKPRGVIEIDQCLSVKGAEDAINREFAFELSTKVRSPVPGQPRNEICPDGGALAPAVASLPLSLARSLPPSPLCFLLMCVCVPTCVDDVCRTIPCISSQQARKRRRIGSMQSVRA